MTPDSLNPQPAPTPEVPVPGEAGFATGAETGGDLESDAGDDVLADSGSLVQPPDADTDPDSPSHEGKKVFRPGELNNAGEDKDYFPHRKDHQFSPPKDANDHALTPDVEVTPDKTVKTIK